MTNEEMGIETRDPVSSSEDDQEIMDRTDAPPEGVQAPEHDTQEVSDDGMESDQEAAEVADDAQSLEEDESADEDNTPVEAVEVPAEETEVHEEGEADQDAGELQEETGELPEETTEALQGQDETAQEADTVVQEGVPFAEDVERQDTGELEEAVEEGGAAVREEAPSAESPGTQEQIVPSEAEAPTVESVIEAILFATDEPLTESRLAGIVETTGKQVRESVANLNGKYEANHNAFRIEQIAGGYQMLTLPLYNHWLKKMVTARSDSKLSPAALETLAIIAYKQPIIRADIEAIRGVAAGEVIRSLMYKGLVKIAGRAEILGRPILYGTTKKFLEVFGLNSLKDLPKAEDLKNPDRG